MILKNVRKFVIKVQRAREEEEEWHKEREYVQNLTKIYKQEDELSRLKHKQKANDYKDDLIQQMNYLEDERDQVRKYLNLSSFQFQLGH